MLYMTREQMIFILWDTGDHEKEDLNKMTDEQLLELLKVNIGSDALGVYQKEVH